MDINLLSRPSHSERIFAFKAFPSVLGRRLLDFAPFAPVLLPDDIGHRIGYQLRKLTGREAEEPDLLQQHVTEMAVQVHSGGRSLDRMEPLRKKAGELAIQTHDTAQAALSALAAHPGDAAIVDAVSARLFIREGEGLQIAGEPLYDELYVVAVHPRARSLQAAIDQALVDMRESGELDALLDRWL